MEKFSFWRGTGGYQGVMDTTYAYFRTRKVNGNGKAWIWSNCTYCPHGATRVPAPEAHSSEASELWVLGLRWLEERTRQVTYLKWWCVVVMASVGIRDKGVSGIFLQLNLRIWSRVWEPEGCLDCHRQLRSPGDIAGFTAAGINWVSFFCFAVNVSWLLFMFELHFISLLLLTWTMECLHVVFTQILKQ